MVWGQDSDESYLRNYWKEIATDDTKEWVNPDDDHFRDWVRFLLKKPFVARTFDECERLPFVDSQHWLPSEKHGVKAAQGSLNFSDDPWFDLELEQVGDGDYYTNAKIIEAARATMGHIDLDPASCIQANTVVKADQFFSALEDGLTQSWHGRIWLNPPFGQWDQWCPKLIDQLQMGNISQACVLVPARAATAKQVHPVVRRADAVFLPNGRIPFWGPKAGTPDEGHPIFYIGANVDRFVEAFSSLGTVFPAVRKN